jgi:hypothetical protein
MIGLGMHGITKFPMFAGLLFLADLFSEDDLDYQLWKAADELDELGIPVGSIMHRGLGSLIDVDLRNTLGESTNLVTDRLAESWGTDWEKRVIGLAMGAPYATIKDMLVATGDITAQLYNIIEDDTFTSVEERKKARRLLGFIPKETLPIFLRNVFTAMKFDKNGIEVRGKVMVVRNDLSGLDIVLKALSFPIEKLTRAYSEVQGGPEAKARYLNKIIKDGTKHREVLRKQGVSSEIIRNEMQRIIEDYVNPAREELRELQPELREIKRKRKSAERELQIN